MIIEQIKKFKSIYRFLIVGSLSTLLDFILYYMLGHFLPNSAAKLISILAACTLSFFLNRNWTFAQKNTNAGQVIRFALAQGVNIGTNVAINAITYSLTESKPISFVAGTGVAMVVNYSLQRWFVFNVKNDE